MQERGHGVKSTCVHTWSCSSASRCALSSSLSELGLLSVSLPLSLLGSLSEEEDDDEEDEEECTADMPIPPPRDMGGDSSTGSSGILANRNSNTSWGDRNSQHSLQFPEFPEIPKNEIYIIKSWRGLLPPKQRVQSTGFHLEIIYLFHVIFKCRS